ncbi:DNA-binding transcriptional LysR family regulator [Variovorax paradoxus]|uniref:DNA-binding transcriptional LysR family regulator n=1 Tax=Variovorax paradoxus TaxID=34073 RepID=A0AAE3Y1J7_VARPD|nr:LysR family transcriptional regulator [Variovorax paradoxus]MDP9964756.1 DNA-binding transcriptional LysR family regulator [Variovorax paradoxus]MDR6427656.1 DNA-binding transcriptional LysR family regulator [Variovorax paradoxus]MDR6454817.1 DNA-binding transcriptional LysR family regulator [Variovorax paradoxus]
MNINSIDLNLFLVFQAIYATRSVTLAGDRLGMTQSAVSNALKRMRERFNDALFVRSADGMVPTPVAERLIAPIEEGIACLVQAVDQGRTFEPETSSRTFRIAVNDIGQLVMVPELLSVARGIAPGVRFETVDVSVAEARQRMLHGQIDVALGSWEAMGPSFYQQRLFDETFVVLISKASPLGTRERIELDDYLAAEHIAYRPQGTTDSQLQQTLERAGALDRRRVVLTAAHSLGLTSIVATSGLLLTAPARLAKAMVASRADLHSVEAPFEVRPFEIRQQWHERFHQDSGNRWLRELIFGLFHERSVREPAAQARAT